MKQKILEKYTKDPALAGQDSVEVMENFITYANLCQDPHNVFRYMEEHAICVYQSHFWVYKSNLYTTVGDYKTAFLCLKEAESRTEIIKFLNVNVVNNT